MMNHEYILPMTAKAGDATLYPSSLTGDNGGNGCANSSQGASLKPQMHFSSPCFVRNCESERNDAAERNHGDSPQFPLELLKDMAVQMLTEAARALCQEVRDPAGGTVELLLVPLIKLAYSLVVMGVLEGEDLGKVLRLLDSGVSFTNSQSPTHEEKDDEKEYSHRHHQEDDDPKIGLLQMKLPEAVKLEVSEAQFSPVPFGACLKQTGVFLRSQLCRLLAYLCDCQMRQRIEAAAAFSHAFVCQLQENQRFRYNEVMQALNMSAALTARKTKEFRSPPREQVKRPSSWCTNGITAAVSLDCVLFSLFFRSICC